MADQAASIRYDDFSITFSGGVESEALKGAMTELLRSGRECPLPLDEDFVTELKFAACLPPGLYAEELRKRFDLSENLASLRCRPKTRHSP